MSLRDETFVSSLRDYVTVNKWLNQLLSVVGLPAENSGGGNGNGNGGPPGGVSDGGLGLGVGSSGAGGGDGGTNMSGGNSVGSRGLGMMASQFHERLDLT